MERKKTLPLASHRAGTLLFWMCWLVYFAAQLGRMNYSVALTGIVDTGFLPKSTAGLIGTCFYFCYGSGQLLSGWLGDRVNCYLLLLIGLAGSALTNLWMSFADGLAPMMIAWGINGIVQSLLWTPLLKLFATALPSEQRTKACVNIATTTPLGALACYLLSNWALSRFGWHQVFFVSALPMLVCSLVFAAGAYILSKQPTARPAQAPAAAVSAAGQPAPSASYRLGPLLVMSGVLFMMLPIAVQSVLKDGMTTWTPTMLTETFAVDPSFAVTLTMILPIPNLIGGYLGTWVNEKFFRNELKTASVFFAFSFACLAVMYFTAKLSIWCVVTALALVVMAMHAVNIMIITFVPVRFSKYGHTGMVSGVLNATAYLGGAVSTYGIGWFAEKIGWGGTMLLWVGLCGLVTAMCALIIPRWARFLDKTSALPD